MPMTCVAYGCNNHFVKGCGKQFFRFPMKDPERLTQWVVAIRRKNWRPSASSRICSDHFTNKDYMLRPGALVPRLRLDAVPSIFEGFPKRLKDRLQRKKKNMDEHVVVICSQMETQNADQLGPVKEETIDPSLSTENSEHLSGDAVTAKSLLPPTTTSLSEGLGNVKRDLKAKHGPLERRSRTCVVYGCNNTLVKGSGKRFFRFPLTNPKRLRRWIHALQITEWALSTSSRICSDHFGDHDFIVTPGMDKLRFSAKPVPSVFKAKSRKSLKLEAIGEEQAMGSLRPPDHTYSAVHNAMDVPSPKPDTSELKKKVKTLQRQVQRQRHTIKKLSERLSLLQKNKGLHALCQKGSKSQLMAEMWPEVESF
ncbi:THAP domain-containing protein 3-like [Gastrophryne carolinensis]